MLGSVLDKTKLRNRLGFAILSARLRVMLVSGLG